MDFERLREKVLEQNYPGEEELEETREKYGEISDFIQEQFSLETHFAGSSSRGTCMKGDRDIDIFVLFPEETGRQELEDQGLRIGKEVFEEFDGEYTVEYAEHPYTKGEINGHEVEIVPCYDVEPENIKSAVDRTPHHSRWVDKNLDGEQRRDAVLLKTFLRAAGIYGSSLKVQGFSGYLCEILVAHYGSFQELVQEAVNWREEEVIDPRNHHENGLPGDLEEKFEDEPLVVIDPVDPERNVASVLSEQNLAEFIYRCWKFRKEPGIYFFREEELEIAEFDVKQEIEKRGDFLVLEFERPEGVEDIVYPQLRKTLGRIEDELDERDFRVFESGFHVDESTRIFFELDRDLPEIEELEGPKVFHGPEHMEEFSTKYDNVFVKDDRLYAKTERRFTDAKEFLKQFLQDDLEGKGVPGRVAEVIEGYSFVEATSGEEEWLKYLAKKLRIKGD